MARFSYERLLGITKDTKPYRGTGNQYPIMDRNHGYKRFHVHMVDGKIEFHLQHGFRYDLQVITKERYVYLKDVKKHYMPSIDVGEDGEDRYRNYERSPQMIGIVREDNTFEFTADDLHQGIRYFLSQGFNGWFYSSVKHGGVICKCSSGYYSHNHKYIPIFKGMRVNADTFIPHDSQYGGYTVISRNVNRKKGKEVTQQYRDKLKFAEVMYKTMDIDAFRNELMETKKSMGRFEYWNKEEHKSRLIEADALIESDSIKGVAMFMILFNIMYANNISEGYSARSTIEPHSYYVGFFEKFIKQMYIKHNAFDNTETKLVDGVRSSNWATVLKDNGVVVKQYNGR
jgi:hypothetical protein